MKVVIAGGTGQIGQSLIRHYLKENTQSQIKNEVILLSRASHVDQVKQLAPPAPSLRLERWDGKTVGDWSSALDGADVVINLAGRTVNCRYTPENLKQMMDSRVESTTAIGAAIAQTTCPPKVWLQMSTATIYAHSFDTPTDEHAGVIGGAEPNAPAYWAYSVQIAQAWERAQEEARTPQTRKVSLRTAMTMTPDRGGIFDVLFKMTRLGLGGAVGGGAQFVSWIHEADFIRAVDLLIQSEQVSGPVNICAPNPLPQREFMRALREAMGVRVGLPATAWMAEVGAFFMRTDTELLLKSRRVTPGRLLELGMEFQYPEWREAARELVRRRGELL